MAVTTLAAPVRLPRSVATLPLVVAAAIFVILVMNGAALLHDPDTYSHLALGHWIIAHGWVPSVDPLSATMAGKPWIAFEWLSEIAYTLAYTLSGWSGVVILAAAAVALAFVLLADALLQRLPVIAALLIITAAFVLAAPHVLARPHVLTWPLLVIWTIALLDAADGRRAPPFALLPLMTLWANLHGSFLIGLGLVAGLGVEAVWFAAPAARRALAIRWLAFGVLALVAALINPYGPGIFLVIVETMNLGSALGLITEWQPQNFAHLGPFEIVLLAGFGYALFAGVKLPWTRILMLLGLLHLALTQTRQADVLAMTVPLLLARPLAEQLAAASDRYAVARTGALPASAAAATLLLAAVAFLGLRPVAPAAANTPAAAIAATDLAHAGPILNSYDFGGYLDYAGIAPFVDGRTELFGRDFTVRYTRDLALADIPDFLALLDQYGIRATLLRPGAPAIGLLDRLPEWKRVYADGVAVVLIRQTPAAR
jgi:hypothetical protein